VYEVVEPETLLGPGPGRGCDVKAELEWTPNLKEYELRTWLSGLSDGDVRIDDPSVAHRLVDAFKTRAPTVFRTPDRCDLCGQDPVGWAHHAAADRPISEEPIGLCQEHLNSENWSEELGWCSIHRKWGRLGAKGALGPHQFEVVPPPAQA
jgi:hypothetical protein